MSTVKSKKLQVGTDASASNNFTIYQPATPDGTLRIGVGNADSPTEVGRFDSNGYVATNAPAFRAYNTSSSVTVNTSTTTKATYPTETFDSASCYDTTTSRFTPNVAGYYLIGAGNGFASNTSGTRQIFLYKNGSELSTFHRGPTTSGTYRVSGSTLTYANGTTDYFEIYLWQDSGSNLASFISNESTVFWAYLARAI